MPQTLLVGLVLLISSFVMMSCMLLAGATVSPLPTPPPSPLSAPASADLPAASAYHFGKLTALHYAEDYLMFRHWLPDNERVTVVALGISPAGYQESTAYGTFNMHTGEVVVYGSTDPLYPESKPIWLDDTQEMAFTGVAASRRNQTSAARFLWAGGPGNMALAEPRLGAINAVDGYGHLLYALPAAQDGLVELNRRSREMRRLPIYVKPYGIDPANFYAEIAAHRTLPLLAIFDTHAFVIADLAAGTMTAVDLGPGVPEVTYGPSWGWLAAWSSTEPQIAVMVVNGDPIFNISRLFVFDWATGCGRYIPLPVQYVTGFTWAPDGQHLLVRGKPRTNPYVGNSQASVPLYGFYLVDTARATFTLAHTIGVVKSNSQFGWDLDWSPDGSKLLIQSIDVVGVMEVSKMVEGSKIGKELP